MVENVLSKQNKLPYFSQEFQTKSSSYSRSHVYFFNFMSFLITREKIGGTI